MPAVSLRERWLLGIGALVAAAIAGWFFVLEPLLDGHRKAAELIPARQQVLAKRRDLLMRRPAIEEALTATNRQVEELTSRLLPTTTPAVAASELQKLVKELAEGAGLEVRSERILPTVERGDLLEIPVEIAVAGGIRELVTLLQGLEAAPKLLTLQDVKIRVVSVGQPKALLTSLTLSGFILPKPVNARAL